MTATRNRNRVARGEWHVHVTVPQKPPEVPRLSGSVDLDGQLTPLHMESLPTLFHRALLNVSKASNLPTIQDETQASPYILWHISHR
jgi:hypothetical protein